MSKQLIDFQTSSASTADTGEVEASAIRPVANTEPASEATFNRPTENLRARTEILRKELEGIKYLLDADRAILLSGGGAINWNATAGTFTIAQNMSVRPFMSPAASKEAKLVTNGLTITADKTKAKPQRAYGRMDDEYGRGANDISVEIVTSATATTPYAVTVTGSPANNVKVTVSTNVSYPATVAGLKTFLNAASAFTGLGLSAAGAATDTLDATFALASTRLQGALDAELHVITPAGLVTFFNTAANALLDGDCLVVAYDKLVEPTGAGGRRQSLRDDPEKSSASPTQTDITVVDNNLANLSAHPEKVTYAIPICTREGADLVFLDGTRIRTGIAGSLGGIGSNVGETISGNLNVTGKVIAAQSDTGSGFATADTAKARFRGAASTANTTLVVEAAAGQTGNLTAWTDASGAAKTVIDSAGLLESKVATGTAPLKVASSTKVDNLNADKLDGYDWNDVPSLGTSSTTVTAGTVNADSGITRSSSGALNLGNGSNVTSVLIGTDGLSSKYVDIGYSGSSTNVKGHLNVTGDLNANNIIGRSGTADALNIGNDADVTDINLGTASNTGAIVLGRAGTQVTANGTLNANAGIGRSTSGALDIGNDADVTDINIGTVSNTGQIGIGQSASAVTIHAGLSANANATIRSSSTSAVALTVEGESSGHTQNLQEWKANGDTVVTVGANGAITSNVAQGTAPFVIPNSTTKVTNLNADKLDGSDWAAPAVIGGTTPNAGYFSALTVGGKTYANQIAALNVYTNGALSDIISLPKPTNTLGQYFSSKPQPIKLTSANTHYAYDGLTAETSGSAYTGRFSSVTRSTLFRATVDLEFAVPTAVNVLAFGLAYEDSVTTSTYSLGQLTGTTTNTENTNYVTLRELSVPINTRTFVRFSGIIETSANYLSTPVFITGLNGSYITDVTRYVYPFIMHDDPLGTTSSATVYWASIVMHKIRS